MVDPFSDITYSFTCDGTEWQGVRVPSENSSSSGGPVPVETEVPVEP